MPTIRVDDEVFKALQNRAQPFVDSPNDVIRRLLGLASQRRGPRGPRAPAGAITPQQAYRPLILKALAASGGSATMRAVLGSIRKELDGAFRARDLALTATGAVVWENKVQWERLKMVQEGLLKADSPRGIWELSSAGTAEARALAAP